MSAIGCNLRAEIQKQPMRKITRISVQLHNPHEKQVNKKNGRTEIGAMPLVFEWHFSLIFLGSLMVTKDYSQSNRILLFKIQFLWAELRL